MLAQREGSLVVLVDMQPSFLNPIWRSEKILERCRFLLESAKLLDVPVIATEQYPSRMGGTEESLLPYLSVAPIPKMTFSCAGCELFVQELRQRAPKQVILVGIETHICVNQTAHHLLGQGFEVFLGMDAISSRSSDMHFTGVTRIHDAGAVLAHTESLVYEWLNSAEDPKFKEALQIVKRYSEAKS
jgi:nicotinamidase-related amidase